MNLRNESINKSQPMLKLIHQTYPQSFQQASPTIINNFERICNSSFEKERSMEKLNLKEIPGLISPHSLPAPGIERSSKLIWK